MQLLKKTLISKLIIIALSSGLTLSAGAVSFPLVDIAANKGLATAQATLGYMYRTGYEGKGVPQNYLKTIELYRQAADQGYSGAQNNIGHMFENGEGFELDDAKAAEWYLKAANQGVAEAQSSLGLMYFEGRGVKQDKVKSQEWYSKSCENGYWPSCDEL